MPERSDCGFRGKVVKHANFKEKGYFSCITDRSRETNNERHHWHLCPLSASVKAYPTAEGSSQHLLKVPFVKVTHSINKFLPNMMRACQLPVSRPTQCTMIVLDLNFGEVIPCSRQWMNEKDHHGSTVLV
ncbi:hypothetical protein Btru_037795 [Bulinus truncatus]|nr:hypothetical protein Btru_037795 [Bulinus truncatus]